MVSITLSVPPETREIMNNFPEMNWSGFVRKCIEEKVRTLSWKEEMLQKLENEKGITEWAVETTKKARKGSFIKLRKRGLV